MRLTFFSILALTLSSSAFCADAAPEFAVVSIRPSAGDVKFEHDGKTTLSPASLTMEDVTVATCLKFAYDVQDTQIAGPQWLQESHFDIIARAASPTAPRELKLMMRALLADRFHLTFHHQTKELKSYALTVAPGGHKLHPSAPGAVSSRENTAISTIAKGMTIKEFADFIAGPLHTPVVDLTGLPGKYDFTLDFTAYLPPGEPNMRPDFVDNNGIIISAIAGELGLKMESKKESVDILAIDRVEAPTPN